MAKCKALAELDLSNNKIQNVDELKSLRDLNGLTSLKLYKNMLVMADGLKLKLGFAVTDVITTIELYAEGQNDRDRVLAAREDAVDPWV